MASDALVAEPRSAASSAASPISGSGSSFQSPVCSTVPTGVRITTALGSGIEWVRVISSSSNGPIGELARHRHSVIGTLSSSPASTQLARSSEAVNGVAQTGQRSRGHR